MVKYRVAAVLLLALSVAALAQRGRAAYGFASAPKDEAQDVVERIARGSYSSATDNFSDRLRATLTPDALRRTWSSFVSSYGPFRDSEVKAVDLEGDEWHIHVLCTMDKGYVDVTVTYSSITNDQKVLGLSFRPMPMDGPITF